MTDETLTVRVRRAATGIVRNRIVHVLLIATALYWIAALTVVAIWGDAAKLVESSVVALMGVLAVVIWRWAPVTFADLASGNTGGRAQLLLGLTSMAATMEAWLLWSLIWRWSGFPDWMIVSAWLGYLRFGSVAAAALMLTSTSAATSLVSNQSIKWLVAAAVIAAALLGFSFGAVYGAADEAQVIRIVGMDDCPPSAPIKGNLTSQGRRIYHVPRARSYSATLPEVCFPNVREAQARGYRPPG